MIKTIIKLDGSKEEFAPSKLNHWGEWAAKPLGEYVDWSTVVLSALTDLPEEVTSQQLQQELVNKCLDQKTWSYYLMAGKLYVPLMRKAIFGTSTPPTIWQVHSRLIGDGLMVYLDYSPEEYAHLETIIDHDLDFQAPQYSLYHMRYKYALRNQITKKEYELPQFTYMRMAMALGETEPKDKRLMHVEKWYRHFSESRLSAPTPNYVNLGTSLRGYASCCLYIADDDGISLATGDYIANIMTQKSAGIGNNLNTRSIGDGVRGGVIRHQGKLPYYSSAGKSVAANLQNGRGGACTTYYSGFDPEAEDIAQLANPRSVENKRNRDLHYALMTNAWFTYKVAKNEPIFSFNIRTAPDLNAAFYSGNIDKFVELYEEYEANPKFKKKYISARKLLMIATSEAFETGIAYLASMDEINRHTPFKEPIFSSNLCVAPETKILTQEGEVEIQSKVDQSVNIWNGWSWSKVDVVRTGVGQPLTKVLLTNGKFLECTGYHKWYIQTPDSVSKEVRTFELSPGDQLIEFHFPDSPNSIESYTVAEVIQTNRFDDTYCFTELERGKAVFNGILTGQCAEIVQPTKTYPDASYLYRTDDHGQGEISTCNLAAVIVQNIKNDEQYAEVCYYALKMIDKTTEMAEYAFPHLRFTALQRRNAGVGVMGMSNLMTMAGVKIANGTGKRFAHKAAETHMWHLIGASLKIAGERGVAPWIHKTKWPEGWIPLDTYNRGVDEIGDFPLLRDWEARRREIIAMGGLAHSVVCAFMPGESSSKAIPTGVVNSIYPTRSKEITKGDGALRISWAAFESDRPGMDYELAWEIPMHDMIDYYAIWQKFCDQSISADEYRRLQAAEVVTEDEVVGDFLYRNKRGVKTRYYFNTQTATGKPLDHVERAFSAGNQNDSADEQVPAQTTTQFGFVENNDAERGCIGGACSL